MHKKYFLGVSLFVFISLQAFAGNKNTIATTLATGNFLWNYAWSSASTCTGLTVTITKTNICVNGTGGSATANPSGGTGKYTYSWSNADTTKTITGLTAGTYDLTVTDSNGCSGTATVTILHLGYIINTVAGNGTQGFAGDGGPATAAEFHFPWKITFDSSGNLYTAEYFNMRIRKINTNGIISTIAGNGIQGFAGDGGPATAAEFSFPVGVGADNAGTIYIADQQNNRIRKINRGDTITTIAGTGRNSYCCFDGGLADTSSLYYPSDVIVDPAGNIYIADASNNAVRKINTSGIITRFAGIYNQGAHTGDGGPATAAKIDIPSGLAIDAAGNIYIAEHQKFSIRKVNTNGIITTVAGKDTTGGFSGDGGPATNAELSGVFNVAVDNAGNIYIPDIGNNRLRMVNTNGIISTIAGNGVTWGSGPVGDGNFAVKAEFGAIESAVLDDFGNIYVTDATENRIRELYACGFCGLRAHDSLINDPTCNGNNGVAQVVTFEGIGQNFSYSWMPTGGNNFLAAGLSSGTYTTTVTDSIGCTSSAQIALTSSGVTASINGPDSICMGGEVTLTANGGTSYLWSDGSTNASVVATLTKDSTFTVTASDGGCNGMATFIVYVGTDQSLCALQFYHGITPNGDGHNDFWQIDNIELFPGNIVEIYNRWGSLVWNANGYDNNKIVWRGQDNQNKPLPDGTYYYVVKMQSVTYKGWVQLTR